MSQVESATASEPRLHYWAFDWHDQDTSILNLIQAWVSEEDWSQLKPLLATDRSQFFHQLPEQVRQAAANHLRTQLLAYIWEAVGHHTGLFPFRYTLHSPHKVAPFGQINFPNDFLNQYANAPLARPGEILDDKTLTRRLTRRHDEIVGLATARSLMLGLKPGDLLIWTSPPGHRDDGYPGFSFIFFAQRHSAHPYIDCYSLIVDMDLINHTDLINHFSSQLNRLPTSATIPDILHRAILLPNTTIPQVVSFLEVLLTQYQEKPTTLPKHPANLDQLLNQYFPLIDTSIATFFGGETPDQLQKRLQSFNRSHRQEISIATGGSFSTPCGKVDMGEDPRALPGQKHENSKPFPCPACGTLIDPCLTIVCPSCSATKDNWRQAKARLEQKQQPTVTYHTYQLPNPTRSLAPPRNQPSTTESVRLPNFQFSIFNFQFDEPETYTWLIVGLSVLKLHRLHAARFGLTEY